MRLKLFVFFSFVYSFSFAQIRNYHYQREILDIKEQWHKIVLQSEITSKTKTDLSDIRIIGINKNKDTIEAPYILRLDEEKTISKEIDFKIINESHDQQGYYYTFEISKSNSINQINLNFLQKNFDWLIHIEGSQDLKKWYTIAENQRVVSIKNEQTEFTYSSVIFPDSKYLYYRIFISSDIKPNLQSAKLILDETKKSENIKYKIKTIKNTTNKSEKLSIIDIDLISPAPVCKLKLFIKNKFDFYRNINILYLTDSIKTQKGWIYNYEQLSSATLNSIEKSEFKFKSTVLKRLRLIIENKDNQALTIDSISVEGYQHELIARFDNDANYYLVYGNKNASFPNYDIKHFEDKIPNDLKPLYLGKEQVTKNKISIQSKPLFENKLWLWIIMVIVIITIGWFSISMIKK